MLEVTNLVKNFGDNTAVNNVSFTVRERTIFGLLGRNGAGKSTIFRCILNILEADSGEILYNSKIITNKLSNRIGYLPEEGSLILTFTVLEQALYYGALKQKNRDYIQEELVKWLKKFDILEYMNKKIKDLSKGNRQKIQFIIAVLHNPDLLILDEPFSGLDPISVSQLEREIINLKNEGKTIIFSSHRMDHVEKLCEEILILEKSNPILQGNLKKIKQESSNKKVKIIGEFTKENLEYLQNLVYVKEINVNENEIIIILEKNCKLSKLLEDLKGITITDFSTLEVSLNDLFIEKVGREYEQ